MKIEPGESDLVFKASEDELNLLRLVAHNALLMMAPDSLELPDRKAHFLSEFLEKTQVKPAAYSGIKLCLGRTIMFEETLEDTRWDLDKYSAHIAGQLADLFRFASEVLTVEVPDYVPDRFV